MTRKAIGKQLAYLRRDLDAIDSKLSLGKNLPPRHAERLGTIRAVYEQQKYMYDNRTHSVPDRIVSVSQPFVRPIVRGKAGKPVEFGAKLDISVVDGWTRLECCSFDAYHEAGNLREMAERFRAREGHSPSRILADKIYRNRENLSYCKAHGIRLSGPALGRPKKGETRDKAQDYRDECERVEVERRFTLAKRKCGMGLVTAKLRETAAHVIAMSVLVLNLRKIQCALLRMLTYLLEIFAQKKNWTLVQWTLIRHAGKVPFPVRQGCICPDFVLCTGAYSCSDVRCDDSVAFEGIGLGQRIFLLDIAASGKFIHDHLCIQSAFKMCSTVNICDNFPLPKSHIRSCF